MSSQRLIHNEFPACAGTMGMSECLTVKESGVSMMSTRENRYDPGLGSRLGARGCPEVVHNWLDSHWLKPLETRAYISPAMELAMVCVVRGIKKPT